MLKIEKLRQMMTFPDCFANKEFPKTKTAERIKEFF